MNIDLSAKAGFPLIFDATKLTLADGADLDFKRVVRRAADLAQVLMDPAGVDPQTELYYMDEVIPRLPEQQEILDRYGLTYSTVLLPPLQIGDEFVKTHGHYHPPLPDSQFEFPEVYTQLYGALLLLMQKRSRENPDLLEDCAVTMMTPGYVITIPPGYAHILINPTAGPALMAGLYGKAFKPDYAPIRARQGLAYYVLADAGGYMIAPNPRYPDAPRPRWLGKLRGTIFEPPFPHEPVWQAYFRNPDPYSFLTRPQAVQEKFGG
jgi:glucose-6-phosphate isomerase, archaeal